MECVHLGLWHRIAAGKIVRGEQEHIVYTGFIARLQQSIGAALGRAEQAESVGYGARTILGDGGGIVRVGNVETCGS